MYGGATLEIPKGEIVYVNTRSADMVEFWLLTSGSSTSETRTFQVFATGYSIPNHGVYVGTTFAMGGALVWHLFEVVNVDEQDRNL